MAQTDAQKRATAKYRKDKMKSVTVAFGPADRDLYEYLDTVANKAGYIKALIRADMERQQEKDGC